MQLTLCQNVADLVRSFASFLAFFPRRRALEAVLTSLEVEYATVAVPIRRHLIVLSIGVLREAVLNERPILVLQDEDTLNENKATGDH